MGVNRIIIEPTRAYGQDEILHIAKLNHELQEAMASGMIVNIELGNGDLIEGVLKGNTTKSSGADTPVWYSGMITIITLDRNRFDFDLLEIKRIFLGTNEKSLEKFEKAGIIKIVSYEEEPI